mmetsp:Transcript_34563/g.48169  ORF Transcript_34563/g.48169 Transcript_34563/m.48169 type:complete len:133 (+) Transcript_34563:80-478(+)
MKCFGNVVIIKFAFVFNGHDFLRFPGDLRAILESLASQFLHGQVWHCPLTFWKRSPSSSFFFRDDAMKRNSASSRIAGRTTIKHDGWVHVLTLFLSFFPENHLCLNCGMKSPNSRFMTPSTVLLRRCEHCHT